MTPCSTPCAGLFCATFLQAPRTENHDFMALTGGRSPAVAAETVQVRVEIKQPLGIAIIGSLIVSHLLTPYTTPVVYLYLDRFSRWWGRQRQGDVAAMQVPEAGE